jgi:hypothetical protein
VDKKSLGLIIAGYASLGIGIGLLGGMGGAIGTAQEASDDAKAADVPSAEEDRIDAIDRGERADRAAIGLGVAGGVLVVTGAILAGVAHSRFSRSRKTAHNLCLPAAGRGSVGVGCQLRF